MRTLQGRLIFSHILPLLLVLPLVAIALVYLLETQVLLTEVTDDLTERATIIAKIIESSPAIIADQDQAQDFITSFSLDMEEQVMIMRPNGEILAISGSGPVNPTMEPLILEGIETARAGQTSVSVTYDLLQRKVEVLMPVQSANQELQFIVGVTDTLAGVSSQFDRLRKWVLVILAIELLLGCIIGALLARRLARPISRVSNAIIDISDGQSIATLPAEGPQELQRLSTAVNLLAERLRILEETRRRSLANIVHELSRPLGAMLSAVHVLRQKPGEDTQVRQELLGGVEAEINRMQPLLDDLAQLHGQVTGQLKISRQPTSLSDWLPPLLLPWRAAALDKQQNWSAEISTNLPTIDIDPERIAQAIGNLLSNAIKYTPQGGQVSVTAGTNEGQAWITVQDSGPGIALDEQEHVFEAFYRSTQEQRFPQGLGLGLTIARDLVEAHGGHLILESTPGEGCRFIIQLPY
jgi:two-component system sensor histidine kinase BaeS